jgi:hypothetical protein
VFLKMFANVTQGMEERNAKKFIALENLKMILQFVQGMDNALDQTLVNVKPITLGNHVHLQFVLVNKEEKLVTVTDLV